MARWTEFGAGFGPWIGNSVTIPIPGVLLPGLPAWHLKIPSGADACRVLLIGKGTTGGVFNPLRIHGISYGATQSVLGQPPDVQFVWCQELVLLSAAALGSESLPDGGFGTADEVLVCSTLGVVTPSDYYKAMDRATGRAYHDGTAMAYSMEELETDSTTELLIGNLSSLTHLTVSVETENGLAATGDASALNLAVSFRLP